MARYWYDTEFDEDGKTIELISIGVVCEDGREYYAVSTEFNSDKCNDWVKENVIPLLPARDPSIWKTRQQIRDELLAFVGNDTPEWWANYASYDHIVLCQLFGRMVDLPEHWPMYTNDLKQLKVSMGNPKTPEQIGSKHDALEDARHNKRVYDFLMILKSFS